jgi:uncharacterized protein
MSVEQNKAVAAELIKALSTGDADAMTRLLDDNCEWWVTGFPRELTMNRQQMIRGVKAIIDHVLPNGFNISVLGMTAEGDRVAVEAESRSYTTANKLYNNFYHFLFVFRDGKVILGREYTNPSHAIEVLGDVVKKLAKK